MIPLVVWPKNLFGATFLRTEHQLELRTGTSVRVMSVLIWYHPLTLWVPPDSVRIRESTREKSLTALDRIWRESPCRNAVGPHQSVTA